MIRYYNGKIKYECEYLFEKKWNVKEYDINGNILYELKEGSGKIKNIIMMEWWYLKENI